MGSYSFFYIMHVITLNFVYGLEFRKDDTVTRQAFLLAYLSCQRQVICLQHLCQQKNLYSSLKLLFFLRSYYKIQMSQLRTHSTKLPVIDTHGDVCRSLFFYPSVLYFYAIFLVQQEKSGVFLCLAACKPLLHGAKLLIICAPHKQNVLLQKVEIARHGCLNRYSISVQRKGAISCILV